MNMDIRQNIIFIGMPAVGKSTIGIAVAKRLGLQFVDTDLLIQRQQRRLLREIIADVGEKEFLKIENEVNRNIRVKNAVISPGGSIIYCEEAMLHFKKIGVIVYLKASYQTIKRRIRNPRRRGVVLGKGQTFRDLYDERIKFFEKYADLTICEDGYQIEETVENVLKGLENIGIKGI